jgi:stage II sporulation protein D
MRRLIVISSLAVALVASVQIPVSAVAGASPVFIVDGHGWGHGHGMGQYGARAMAKAGYTWPQIVHTYYTGVALHRRAQHDRIRVLVKRVDAVLVRAEPRITLTWSSGKTIVSHTGGVIYRIHRSSIGYTIDAAMSQTGPWHHIASGHAPEIRVTASRRIEVLGDHSSRFYAGVLEVRPSGSKLAVIDTLALNQYVAEVVPREMPASWPKAALQAQAVAARTYALRVAEVARTRHRVYDICASAACQVFGGYARTTDAGIVVLENYRSNVATRSTAGQVMLWHGTPILAEYSSSTGGYTASGGTPYLKPRPDPWDRSAPLHSWTQVIDPSQIQARWPAIGTLKTVRVEARDGRGSFGGRAKSLIVSGSRGRVRVTAATFRNAFDLPSDWFRLRTSQTSFRFTHNMGYGTRDAAVPFLQRRLRAEGVYPPSAPITTYFGPITQASLQRYQRAHNIRATGFLGPITRGRLNATG